MNHERVLDRASNKDQWHMQGICSQAPDNLAVERVAARRDVTDKAIYYWLSTRSTWLEYKRDRVRTACSEYVVGI